MTTYTIQGFQPPIRRRVGRRVGTYRTTDLQLAKARAEQIFQRYGIVVAIEAKGG